jgi:uncharacterized protein (DUF433 family)
MTITVERNPVDSRPLDAQQMIERLQQLGKTAPPITTNPQRMSGAPVIGIQRMPITTLLDYLIGGYSLEEFLDSFPGTDRDKVIAALQKIRDAFDDGILTDLLAEKVDY